MKGCGASSRHLKDSGMEESAEAARVPHCSQEQTVPGMPSPAIRWHSKCAGSVPAPATSRDMDIQGAQSDGVEPGLEGLFRRRANRLESWGWR